MDITDLRKKELSNLYAIFKQANAFFDNAEISFLTDKKQLMVTYYIKTARKIEEIVTSTLQSLEINPGNTKDSIVDEMVENLKEILRMDIDLEVKEPGYLMSINRLMTYQIVNLENASSFQQEENELQGIADCHRDLEIVQKSIF